MQAEAQRHEMLAAMGIDIYELRSANPAARVMITSDMRIAVLCAKADPRHPHADHLRKVLPLALGCAAACVDWIEVAVGDGPIEMPCAAVCLLLGADVARAANAGVASTQQGKALVAVADAPQLSLRDALAKRALWQALKPITRHLHCDLG